MEGPHLGHIGSGGGLGGGQTELLVAGLLADIGHPLLGLPFGVGEDLGLFGLRLLHQLVGHPLGGHQRLAHGVLGGAVLLYLLHQDLHLALQNGVLIVQ